MHAIWSHNKYTSFLPLTIIPSCQYYCLTVIVHFGPIYTSQRLRLGLEGDNIAK